MLAKQAIDAAIAKYGSESDDGILAILGPYCSEVAIPYVGTDSTYGIPWISYAATATTCVFFAALTSIA